MTKYDVVLPINFDNYNQVVSPEAPTVTNENGASQSYTPARFDLIPAEALLEVAIVLGQGAKKYGENNWQGIPTNEHLNHAIQHLYAYLSGDRSDGHLSHAICRVLFAHYVDNH